VATILDEKDQLALELLTDPLKLIAFLWPNIRLYDKQAEIVRSVWNNDQTFVHAGNGLGKDFIAGLIALTFFLTRDPVRVITTSVDTEQLEGVLWGEIRELLQSCEQTPEQLGIKVQERKIFHKDDAGVNDKAAKALLLARVAKKGEGLLGWHLPITDGRPRTLLIMDEASGLDDVHFDKVDTWAHRILVIGNPFPCNNFFKKGVKEGDLPDPHTPGRYERKVIHIRGEDSPNVRRAQIIKEKKPNMHHKRLVQKSTFRS
jgi:hypothetical protein